MTDHVQLEPETQPSRPAQHHEAEAFDSEISLKGITYTTIGLVAIVVVSSILMWWMLRGFQKYDERRDIRPSAIEIANPQQPPPAPRLQVAPGFEVINPQEGGQPPSKSDREDMEGERENEDKALSQPGWVDQRQGIVRVPIETAMQMVAQRGLAPLGAAAPAGAPQPPQKPGATLQNTVPQVPARQPEERRQP